VSSHRTSWLNYVGKRSCLLKSRMIRGDSVTASGCLFQLNREMLYIHKNVAQVTDLTSMLGVHLNMDTRTTRFV